MNDIFQRLIKGTYIMAEMYNRGVQCLWPKTDPHRHQCKGCPMPEWRKNDFCAAMKHFRKLAKLGGDKC